MKTPAQRKAAERLRKKALGLVEYTVWVKPEHKAKIKALADHLLSSESASG